MGMFGNFFGGEKGGEKEEVGRINDGGDFMAVPGPDNTISDEETAMLEENRRRAEEAEALAEKNLK